MRRVTRSSALKAPNVLVTRSMTTWSKGAITKARAGPDLTGALGCGSGFELALLHLGGHILHLLLELVRNCRVITAQTRRLGRAQAVFVVLAFQPFPLGLIQVGHHGAPDVEDGRLQDRVGPVVDRVVVEAEGPCAAVLCRLQAADCGVVHGWEDDVGPLVDLIER